MKILGLSFSPRKSGNTVILLKQALRGAKQEGAETELYSVAGKNIRACDGCWACFGKGKCHINDDMQILYDKMLGSEGIIFGTPIYVYSMTGQAKTVLDRMVALSTPDRNLSNKVGGVIVVAGSIGLIDAAKDFYFMIVIQKMVPANLVGVYAAKKGDAREMKQAMESARNLGREMVQITARKFTYPEGFPRNFFAYGTHTR
jgi:multimeric flavodoxin WrbA